MSNQTNSEKRYRRIFYYKDYYISFFTTLDDEVKEKFNWTLQLISSIERVPTKFLKYIKNSSGIYEVRVEFRSNIYRVFCFFDEGNLIILMNGFKKKTNKTPIKEIKLAEKIKIEYFDENKK